MRSRFGPIACLTSLAIAVLGVSPASAAPRQQAALRPQEEALLRALAANPVTAGYAFNVNTKDGRVVLSGRVGTKAVYDAAVRTAIGLGIPFVDRLTIDTAAVYSAVAPAGPLPPGQPGIRPGATAQALSGVPPYVYPQPLFGYLDEPFYGFEPPILSYPPWWRTSASLRAQAAAAVAQQRQAAAPANEPLPTNTVELLLDRNGAGTLRGVVPSEDVKEGLARKASKLPGVKSIRNNLEVQATGPTDDETPPPPPTPFVPSAPANQPAPTPAPAPPPPAPGLIPEAIARPRADLNARLDAALQGRPSLKGLPIQAVARGNEAVLTGRVPSILEAMQAHRAVQQTPGVQAVVDQLEFPLPEEGKPNPLIERGRPEDVEPYLEAQLRRYLGDQAHIDRVRQLGDVLEIRGSIQTNADRRRVEAALRSLPLLRGFRIEAMLNAG